MMQMLQPAFREKLVPLLESRFLGSSHPCEKDVATHCPRQKTHFPLHCLGLHEQHVSSACVKEVQHAVPFVCSREIHQFCSHSGGRAGLLSCLEEHGVHLTGRCADAVVAARRALASLEWSHKRACRPTPFEFCNSNREIPSELLAAVWRRMHFQHKDHRAVSGKSPDISAHLLGQRHSRIARRFGRQRDWLGSSLRAAGIAALLMLSISLADVSSATDRSSFEETVVSTNPVAMTGSQTPTPAPTGPKSLFGPFLDRWATVKVDSDTENEYWELGPFRFLRKETSVLEVVISGFLAGFLVELSNALLLHPLDTLKTRLQTGQSLLPPDPSLLYERLYDGFIPVLATVPALSVFWAVKDVVRRSLIGMVKATLPLPAADILSSTLASACGEAAYVAVKTPGQVLKIEQQTAVFDEDRLRQRYSEQDLSYTSKTFLWDFGRLWEESLRSFPILCAVDVPQVALRTALFVSLHDSGSFPSGAGSDILAFTMASAIASVVCTPLDVARTQLVLSGKGIQRLPSTLWDIHDRQGVAGLLAGWLPRLLWNGLIVGAVLGLCRLQYEDARAIFLVDVLDRFENVAAAAGHHKVLDHAGHPAHHWHPHSHNHAASDRCLPGWDGPKAAGCCIRRWSPHCGLSCSVSECNADRGWEFRWADFRTHPYICCPKVIRRSEYLGGQKICPEGWKVEEHGHGHCCRKPWTWDCGEHCAHEQCKDNIALAWHPVDDKTEEYKCCPEMPTGIKVEGGFEKVEEAVKRGDAALSEIDAMGSSWVARPLDLSTLTRVQVAVVGGVLATVLMVLCICSGQRVSPKRSHEHKDH
eukprot:s2412_g5.t3